MSLSTQIDLETLKAEFDLYGYAIIPDALTSEEVQRIEEATLRLVQSDPDYDKKTSVGRQGMLNEDEAYDVLLTNKEHHAFCDHVFHGSYKFGETGVLMIKPGNNATVGWHGDVPYQTFGDPVPEAPLMLQAIYCITDFTAENGATRILPLSHHVHRVPEDKPDYRHTMQAEAPSGSLILFHGRMWHTASVNRMGISVPYVHRHVDCQSCNWGWLRQDVVDRQPTWVQPYMQHLVK